MMDLHPRHALCPYQRKGFPKDFPYLYPGILEHFPCLHQLRGLAWISISASGVAIGIFLAVRLPTGAGWSPSSCALGPARASRIFVSTEGGRIPFSSLPTVHLSVIPV